MAVIYARQSLDRDGEGVAVARQLQDCRNLAKLHGLTVDREFIDNDRSATKGPRPAFDELLDGIRAGDIDTIVCWHTDRLYRRVSDLVDLVELAEKHSLKIVTVKGGDLDLTTPAGRMIAGMLGHAAAYEVQHKSERQKSANLARAKQGERQFSTRPFGYERVDGEIRVVEEEAAVIREAVNRYLAGESWYAIARDFKTRGIVGISGRPFSYQNLRQRAINPALAGVRTYRGEVVSEEGAWPPIIDKITWERFQTALAVRGQQQGWDKKIKYLGSGLYRCGKCGGVMKVTRDYPSRMPVYMCENLDVRRRLDRVDELVESRLIARLSQPDVLKLLAPSEDVSALAAESQDLRARIEGLAELFADGTLSSAAVRAQKTKLDARLHSLQQRIAAAEGGEIIGLIASADDVERHWRESMPLKAKRRILDALMTVTIQPTTLGGRNEFRPEHVTIEWRS